MTNLNTIQKPDNFPVGTTVSLNLGNKIKITPFKMLFTFLSLQISKFEVTNPEGNFMLALRTARWREDSLVLLMFSVQKVGKTQHILLNHWNVGS